MQEAFLEMVTRNNNNKFYHMVQCNNSVFSVTYGRIGTVGTQVQYPMGQWNKKYSEKIRKGYVDVTHLQEKTAIQTGPSEYMPIKDSGVAALITYLRRKANDTIKANYKIEVTKVSEAMVREAQAIIDGLLHVQALQDFNDELLRLFVTLPRKMSEVNEYLLYKDSPDKRQEIISREQHLLDVMSSQVSKAAPVATTNDKPKNDMTILEAFGLEIEPVTDEDIAIIKKQLGNNAHQFYKAWRVVNRKTEDAFQKFVKENKITKRSRKLFWHGSRTENWWGILKTGLFLRPTNVVTNGKMFGIGIYFAPKAQKSIGYTSLRNACWTRGTSRNGFLALFETAYGKPWIPEHYPRNCSSFTYESLQRACPGASCLYAKAGLPCNGWNLRNDEIIFYKEEQMTIRYLVEIQ